MQSGPSLCFGWFFLVCCFIRFEKCVVISWLSVFCSCYQSGRSGAGLLNYTRYSVCDGVPGSAWLVAPLFLLYFFFQFRFNAITWGICALPSLFRSLFYAFMPREGIYTCVFCPPSSPQRRKPGYAALLRIRGNYFRPYLSIPRVCHRGAAYQWKFSYYFASRTFNKLCGVIIFS